MPVGPATDRSPYFMKQLFLFAFLFISISPLRAQSSGEGEVPPKNNIKLNLIALAATNISLQYERALTPKTSVALGIGLMPGHKLPYTSYVDDQINYQDADPQARAAIKDFLSDARINGFSITPEFRYYLGKRPQRGFYVAPYLRYSTYSLEWSYDFVDESKGKLRPTELKGTLSSIGGGVMIGAQYYIHNISIDWWILGGAYNKNTLRLDAKVDLSDITSDDEADIHSQIQNVTVKGQYLEATIRENGVKADGGIGLPAFRLGLCIGYRF